MKRIQHIKLKKSIYIYNLIILFSKKKNTNKFDRTELTSLKYLDEGYITFTDVADTVILTTFIQNADAPSCGGELKLTSTPKLNHNQYKLLG